MTKDIIHLMGCADCVQWLANGEAPDHEIEWSADNIKSRWRGYHVCVAGDENTEEHFSWRSCDVCGSRLGGSRYPCAAWETKNH